MHVRRGLAALLCVALLGLAGCTDAESSADPGDPTTSAEPSPTVTKSSEPSVPPEAQGTDEASAKAFVRFYFSTFNSAMHDGKVDQLRMLSRPGCKSCIAFAGNIEAAYRNGGRVDAEGWTPKRIQRVEGRLGMVFLVKVWQGQERIYAPDGSLKSKFDGGLRNMSVYLVARESGWSVKRLDLLT